ncbi:MAG: cation transporter [Anaerolineaceae bacterium]|nr:cation transporter [Anaerolineaceae bacterium]
MRWTRDYQPQPDQSRLYTQALIITLAGNILLAAAKALVAYLTGSVAVYADAANSISDVVYSLLMVFGLWVARRPPDISHPQGHNRFEPLVGMAVTFSMAFAGFEAARAAISRLVEGGSAVDPGLPTLVLLSGALVKALMFWRVRWIARRTNSPTLATTATDNLSDVLTSLAALVGAVGSTFLHPLTDPIAGILVALWIFRNVVRAGKENLDFLTGAGADPALRERLVDVAQEVPGVQRVHHLMTEYTGTRLVVDLHINVDGEMTLRQAHDIADEIIERLQAQPEVDRAYVHIEPEGYD